MRHRIFGKKLGRNTNQRRALFRVQIRSFFTHGKISTTQAKVKAIIPAVEKLCSRAQKSELLGRRQFQKLLGDDRLVSRIVAALRLAFPDQTSNFTKIIRVKRRLGDQAVIVKLVFTKPYQLK